MLNQIFKAYDVRGVYPKELNEETAYKIGRAFVSFLKCMEVVVGTDMRLSSPSLSKSFMQGLVDQGADAIFIGEVCTDALYFASGYFDVPAVMFTASHNPAEYNGMKFCRKGAVPINADTGLQQIKSIAYTGKFESKKKKIGKIRERGILKEYVRHVLKFIDTKRLRDLKVAVDAGNGMAGKMVPLVFRSLPMKIIPLYFELDGSFPNHPADPSKYDNLKDLLECVKRERCDFGMGFDGDADRIFFVDELGSIINSSIMSALIIKSLLKLNVREKIIYNAVCSRIVPETIIKHGGVPIIERVGHSFIKETMRKTKALFACEHSAHFYYRENYRADSGIITSLIVSEIVSREKKPLSSLLGEFRKYHTIEETNVQVQDKEKKLREIESVYKRQGPIKISKLDGLTVEFGNWWFNVRPSNTEPLLRLNLEAETEEIMAVKKEDVLKLMQDDR